MARKYLMARSLFLSSSVFTRLAWLLLGVFCSACFAAGPENIRAVVIANDVTSSLPAVYLSWSVAEPTDADVQVIVEKSLQESGTFETIGATLLTNQRFIDSSVEPGISYAYRLSTVDGNTSAVVTVAIPLPDEQINKPNPPDQVAAVPQVEPFGVGVRWTSSGSEIAEYIVLRRTSNDDFFSSIGVVSGAENFFLDRNLTPDTSYAYRIIAVNGDGIASDPSDTGTLSIEQIQLFLSAQRNSPEEALNKLCLSGDELSDEAEQQCQNLLLADQAARDRVLNQARSRQLKGMANTVVGTLGVQLKNVAARLKSLRHRHTRLDLGRFRTQVEEYQIPLGRVLQSFVDLHSAANDEAKPGFGVFVSGQVEFGTKDDTVDEQGYDVETQGITMGLDMNVGADLVLGSAIGFATGEVDYDDSGSALDTDSLTLSVFGNYYPVDSLYIDLILSAGDNSFDSERAIVEAGFEGTNQSETDGRQYGTAMSMGWESSAAAWSFAVTGRAEWMKTIVDAYVEQGSVFALSVEEQEYTSLKTNLGGRLSYAFSSEVGVILPTLTMDWEHQYSDDAEEVQARFNQLDEAEFAIATDTPDRDHFNVGFSLAATFTHGWMAFASYHTQLGQDDLRTDSFQLGLRYEF